MRLVIHHKDVLLPADFPPQDTVDQRRVALDVPDGFHRHGDQITFLVPVLLQHRQQSRRDLPLEFVLREIPFPARGGRLRADADGFLRAQRHARFRDLGADATGLHSLRLKHVPVRRQHLALRQQRHQMRRHEIARPVQARFAEFGVKLGEPAANRHVRANHQHHIRESAVALAVDLVQNAPCGEHPHHRRLAAAGGHLAGVPEKAVEALRPLVLADFLAGNLDALQKIRARFTQKDDRLRRLQLREEQPLLPPVPSPPLQQLHRRPRHTRIALPAPRLHLGADAIDQLQLDGDAGLASGCGRFRFRVPVVVHGRAAS